MRNKPSNFNLPLRREILEVLITEGDNLLLCDEEGEFVKALLRQLRDLNTRDDSSEEGGELFDFYTVLQQVRLLRISAQARVGEL